MENVPAVPIQVLGNL